MVRYTVLWRKELVDRLATLWATHYDRNSLTEAADQIDADLTVDAHLKGNLFKINQRSISRGPITVAFRVDEGDRKVVVEGVYLTDSN
jgi:hypothetical protein